MSAKSDLLRLLIVLALGLVARLALIIPGFGTLNDPDWYLPLARSLAEGRGFSFGNGLPTAYRPPLYPIVIAPIYRLVGEQGLPFGIAGLHVALGLGTIGLTYLTARRWGLGPNRAALAALIVALDPVAVVQGRAVMTETLAAFLVAGCLAALTVPGRLGSLLGGVLFGLSALCRPSLLPGAVLCAAAMLVMSKGGWRQRTLNTLIFVATLIVTMLPWALRNAARFGEPIWTTTHGGHTLALANNPEYYADVVDGPADSVWTGPNQLAWFERVYQETRGMTQVQADRYLRNEALRVARERPGTFLRASIARLGRFWGIAPSAAVYPLWLRLATAAWTVPLWLALGVGLLRRELWSWPSIVAPLLLLALTAVHSVFWTDMRMRVPVVSAIALISAGAKWRVGRADDVPMPTSESC
jgi:4-amino-4-deoxy-L-arabinose transferase-like glycosyltransferase